MYRSNLAPSLLTCMIVSFFAVILMPLMSGYAATSGARDTSDVSDHIVGAAYTRDDIVHLPVRTIAELVTLQMGVVEARPNLNQLRGLEQGREPLNGPELNIRGGRATATSFFVNGVNMVNPLSNYFTATISPYAISQLSIISGNVPVVYGGAGPGVIDLLGHGGSSEYSGLVEAVSDNMGGGYDQNWYTAQVSGPIPGAHRSFFSGTVERRWLGDRNPSPKTDALPGSPDRLPNNWQSGWSYHGRADYRFTDDLKLTVTADKSSDEWSEYWHVFLFDIDHTPRYRDDNLGLSAHLDHRFDDATAASLSATYFKTERLRGDGVLFDDYTAYQREFVWPDGRVSDLYNPGYMTYDLFYTSNDTLIAFSPTDTIVLELDHLWENYLHYQASTIGLQGNVQRQYGERHEVTVGVDFQRHTLRYFENLNATMGHSPMRVIRYGFDSLGHASDDVDWRHEAKHPSQLGLYVADRFTRHKLTLTAGFRMDVFDYNGLKLKDSLNPFGSGVPGRLDREDLEDTETLSRFSPRFNLRVDVSDRLKVQADFGIHYQSPPLKYYYPDWEHLEVRLWSGSWVGQQFANLTPQKSQLIQVGFSFQPRPSTVIHLRAYHREMENQVTAATLDSVHSSIRTYTIYTDDTLASTARGFDLMLSSRLSRYFDFSAGYTLTVTDGATSFANSDYIINWSNPKAGSSTGPLDYEQKHKLVGTVDLHLGAGEGPTLGGARPLQNLRVVVVAKAGSGLPYTPIDVENEAADWPYLPKPTDFRNSANMDWTSTIDFKAEKTFRVSGLTITPFLWVKNLFDVTNVTNVWRGSGEPDNTGFLNTPDGRFWIEIGKAPDQTGMNFEQKYRLKEANPQNYGPPRQVFFGLRAEF